MEEWRDISEAYATSDKGLSIFLVFLGGFWFIDIRREIEVYGMTPHAENEKKFAQKGVRENSYALK